MLFHLPASLDRLLSLFSDCFTQPSFQSFRGLVVGQISQTARRTVCGMLTGARLAGVWHHARAHRFFTTARWSPDRLGLRLAVVICERLLDPEQLVLVAVDDTLCPRRGRKVHGCFWHRDIAAHADRLFAVWGHSWVVAGIIIQPAFLARPVCLPVLFRLWQPKRKHFGPNDRDPERPGKTELAREIVDLLAARLPGRRIQILADSAYGTRDWQQLPNNVTINFRLRPRAVLNAPAPAPTGKRGRPPTWGERLGTVAQITQQHPPRWHKLTLHQAQTVLATSLRCVWRPLGPDPVRVIILRDPHHPDEQLALITTDPSSTIRQIIQNYAARWTIETCFENAKQHYGLGDPQNRTRNAVQRTIPFQLLTLSLTITWYTLHGHHPNDVAEHRARAPWYLTKTSPSFADMLAKLRRVIIASEFQEQHHHHPTNQQIIQVHQAWAAAGL
jgi:SRSO17 transposase